MLETTHCSFFLTSAICHVTEAIYVAGVHILGFGEQTWRDHLEKLGPEERISKTDFKEIGWKGVD